MGAARGLSSLLAQALQILYPGMCLLCGAPLGAGPDEAPFAPLCPACRGLLVPLGAQSRCRVCSIPLVSETSVCTRCRARHFHFSSAFALFPYTGAAREVIHQLKFANRRSLAPLLAACLEGAMRSRYPGLPIVPAPGNPRAVRRRGWDPMVEVARSLARRSSSRLLRLLGRRPGASQKSLSYDERIRNLRGTITVRRASPPEVVLLDDVFTTGATADECARLLRGAGARRVRVLTLAID